MSWYQRARDQYGIFIKREFPTLLDECFQTPIEGAIYAEIIDRSKNRKNRKFWEARKFAQSKARPPFVTMRMCGPAHCERIDPARKFNPQRPSGKSGKATPNFP